jgi:N-acetylmuramoyl-L-alanine amidase
MILQASYPNQFNSIVNPFFQTSIKRRLLMISKIQNSKFNYLSRMTALPLAALLIFGFTVKNQQLPATIQLNKNYTVVIDAGHGMQDGKHSGAGLATVSEDEIVMNIAEKIKALNGNKNINIILSRTSSQSVSLSRRVEIAKENKADLFLSVHLSASEQDPSKSGMKLYVPSKNETYQYQSKVFASAIQKEISSSYSIDPLLNQSPSTIYVLDKNICPAVLLECGYMTNNRDLEYISKSKNRETVARNILAAIEKYAATLEDQDSGN